MIDSILKKEYEDLCKKPLEVLTIFSDFYGEDKTDLQGIPTFEEVLEESCLIVNVFDYLYARTGSSHLKVKYLALPEEETDFSFRNPLIIDAFYQDYILYLIKNGLFSKIDIMVYFPSVTVTNENGKSIVIKKMFVKVPITVRGLFHGGSLKFNRAEYSFDQFRSNYMHSHISSIEKNRLHEFKYSCLGDGPIRDTIISLNDNFDRDIWVLLCLELSKYLEVESLNGGPYLRLENVSTSSTQTVVKNLNTKITIPDLVKKYYSEVIIEFVQYLTSCEIIPINYLNGSYGIAMNYVDFSIFLSNEFINWWNNIYTPIQGLKDTSDILIRRKLLKRCMISTDKIIIKEDGDLNFMAQVENAERQFACTFKGVQIPIVITNGYTLEHDVLLLNPGIVNSILPKILALININYGTRKEITDSETGNKRTYYRVQRNSKTFLINN